MAASTEQALDFSLKKSLTSPHQRDASPTVIKRLRIDSGSSTKTIPSFAASSPPSSPQSSPQSSQSPSSTTPAASCLPAGFPSALSLSGMFPFLPGSPNPLAGFPSFMKPPLPFCGSSIPFSLVSASSNLDPFSPTSLTSGLLGSGGCSWFPGSTGSTAPNILGSVPDPAFFPTASLALSTLHRRRRSAASGASGTHASAPHPLSPPDNVGGFHRDLTGGNNGAAEQEEGAEEDGDGADDTKDDKKLKGVPDEQKDAAYWERRRKNNEAAKRSRDARRAKEEEIAMRATILEQENLKLRAQVAILKNETAKLHYMLFSQSQGKNGTATTGTTSHGSV